MLVQYKEKGRFHLNLRFWRKHFFKIANRVKDLKRYKTMLSEYVWFYFWCSSRLISETSNDKHRYKDKEELLRRQEKNITVVIITGVYRKPSSVPKLNETLSIFIAVRFVFVFNTILAVEIFSAHPNVPLIRPVIRFP